MRARAAVGFLLLANPLLAQTFGAEFRVNSYTSGDQRRPSLTSFPGTFSPFVAAWDSVAGTQVIARRLNSVGVPQGVDIPVGAKAALDTTQDVAPLGSSPSSGFVVTYGRNVAGSYNVLARLFDGSGVAVGSEFRVNATTTFQGGARVATSSGGEFLVVWVETRPGTNIIEGRRFSSEGTPLGAAFQVNTSTTGRTYRPDVEANAGGGFVVVWRSSADAQYFPAIFARRIGADGAPIGGDFRVNTTQSGNKYSPRIARAGSQFLVAWQLHFGGGPNEIVGQRLDAAGLPVASEFRVDADSPDYYSAYQPNVAGDSAGNFLVVWQAGGDGTTPAVFGRLIGVSGLPIGNQFRVNAYTTGTQGYPAVAASAPGGFLVVWESDKGADPSGFGLVGRFACVHGDANLSGSVDVSDVLYLINALFAAGPAPMGCSDVNGDNATTVADILYLINYLFAGGPAPL